MESFHELFHVLALVGFLGALAAAFVGVFAPLLFPDRSEVRAPALRASLLAVLAALTGLALDWVAHNL